MKMGLLMLIPKPKEEVQTLREARYMCRLTKVVRARTLKKVATCKPRGEASGGRTSASVSILTF